MTKERRIIFGLDDIVAVRVRCTHEGCDGDTVINLNGNKALYLPTGCAVCNQSWRFRKTPVEAEFLKALSTIRAGMNGSIELRFELNDDGPERS